MNRTCPHCGTPLPENAAFCPHCARDLHGRKQPRVPTPMRRRFLLGLLCAAVLAAAGIGLFYARRPYVPQVYDSGSAGEVHYTLDGTAYQLTVAWPSNRCNPAPDIHQSGREGDVNRWPSRLYVNYKDSGTDGWDEFSQQVASVHMEVEQDPQGASDLIAEEPVNRDAYSPDAAMVSVLEFSGGCGEPQVVWVITMNNGDIIRLRQTMHVTLIHTHVYDYHDYPMETMDQLKALLDQIQAETNRLDEVIVYLPPVTYTGQLELTGRSYEFHGCTDGSGRTVFTDTVQVATADSYWINYFCDIDFVGSGGGVGLSMSDNCRAERCSFTGWRTAMLGYGTAWVSLGECDLRNNTIGFHFNSTGQSANHYLFNDNVFADNTTAMLLENVPTDQAIELDGCRFTGNGTDIDNRCDHPLDLSQAVFE